MSIFFSPVHSVKQRITRRRRIRTALHMLSASGVLRPSHVELRYTAPSTLKWLGLEQSTHSRTRSNQDPILTSFGLDRSTFNLSHIKRWIGHLRTTQLQTGQ